MSVTDGMVNVQLHFFFFDAESSIPVQIWTTTLPYQFWENVFSFAFVVSIKFSAFFSPKDHLLPCTPVAFVLIINVNPSEDELK